MSVSFGAACTRNKQLYCPLRVACQAGMTEPAPFLCIAARSRKTCGLSLGAGSRAGGTWCCLDGQAECGNVQLSGKQRGNVCAMGPALATSAVVMSDSGDHQPRFQSTQRCEPVYMCEYG
jgi:hypothetical protein